MGLGLLSTLAAHDLGYLTTNALVQRLDLTLTTMEGLERIEGHYLNWYDTATLAPLRPRYVSTVDSGNLAASLMTLAQGLQGLATAPDSAARLRAGVVDAASLLRSACSVDTDADAGRRQAVRDIAQLARAIASDAAESPEGSPRLTALASELAAASSVFEDGGARQTAGDPCAMR